MVDERTRAQARAVGQALRMFHTLCLAALGVLLTLVLFGMRIPLWALLLPPLLIGISMVASGLYAAHLAPRYGEGADQAGDGET